MFYDLYRNSIKVDFLVSKIAKSSVFSQTYGLPNLGKSCWFNAAIQASRTIYKELRQVLVVCVRKVS